MSSLNELCGKQQQNSINGGFENQCIHRLFGCKYSARQQFASQRNLPPLASIRAQNAWLNRRFFRLWAWHVS